MADQLAARCLPLHGHGVVRAPHISALAERGVVFESAYCNAPLCAPARFTMMTGCLPSRIEAYDNASDLPAEVPSFAHYLRAAGYRTALSGKMHFCGPDQLHGFEERLTTDIYPADYGWAADWEHPEARPSWYHNMLSVSQAGPVLRSNQIDFDEETFFQAQRFLYDAARGGEERPFALVASFTHPHDPYAARPEFWDLYADAEIDPPSISMEPEFLDPHSKRLRKVIAIDGKEPSAEQVLRARRAYYANISYIDDKIGRLLATLEELGLAENTIVVFTGDHGDMLGERGLWYKMSWFEPSSRVPLVISHPASFTPHRVAQSVSLIDLLPTLAELAGDGRAPELAAPIDGRSLLPHLSGGAGHDEVIGEYCGEGAIAPVCMIRRGDHKYICSGSDPDQLFDLARDPDEVQDLTRSAAAEGILAAFRKEAAGRWDMADFRARVVASQRRRLFIAGALRQGRLQPWDFQPGRDASREFMRNHLDLDDVEAGARLERPTRGRDVA